MSRLNPARHTAVRVLSAVENGAHAEDELSEYAPPAGPDRALAWHLVLGVLRKRGTLDAVLAPHVSQGLDKLQPPVRAALRMGLFELNFSRTPPHAAVDQAVEACRRGGARRAGGLVNAVLRKASQATVPDDPFLDLPPWLAERWQGWGDWVGTLGQAPPLCLVAKSPRAPEGLALRPVELDGETVPAAWWMQVGGGEVTRMPGFAEGAWWVMDPAAALTADLALPGPGQGRGLRILDACASPGGKTFRLMSQGAEVVAVDREAKRLDRLFENAKRLRYRPEIRQHDWTQGPLPDGGVFDAVLVDAPCTGLGTIRRHPEIRWRRDATHVAAMAIQQRRVLTQAAVHVVDGGTLVYAVCSPLPEEGRAIVDALEGWCVVDEFSRLPPTGDEDAFQAFVMRRG